eukprot:TRINITY_DN70202_c0_g1_i1.p1 TRINITY_DN70202_c0_g1~~TRINITY_DN70202_c0_g1_i1.p1  ORF type:complete len:1936 (+),score=587.35 TRINITY_DN70202_c0_g1_i1:77-5884(+)
MAAPAVAPQQPSSRPAPRPQVPQARSSKGGPKRTASDADTWSTWDPPTKYSREEKISRLGVDCPSKVVWKVWKPGGEYSRKIELKNCRPRLQVLQYRLPTQKATFFLDFPQPITLSSGMNYLLEVKFRPTRLVRFRDWLEIITDQGSFWIEFEALVPFHAVEHPLQHDFCFCPVKEDSHFTFPLKNTGNLAIDFTWGCPTGKGSKAPFVITPAQGHLKPLQQTSITVTFRPEDASVFVAALICCYDKHTSVFKVSGIGKYPFIKAASTSLDFGEVLVSQTAERTLTLANQSVVPARFRIGRIDRDLEDPFTFIPSQGVIGPEQSMTVRVRYTPQSSGMCSIDDFRLTTPGGNAVDIRCAGIALGPDVSLSSSVLHFGDVHIDHLPGPQKAVLLTNRSECAATFQVMQTQPGCAFVLEPRLGIIGPRKTATLTVSFNPHDPINYCRRVFVLVGGSTTPLPLDLLGTGWHERARPPPFTHAHFVQLLARARFGLGRVTPEEIDAMIARIQGGEPDAAQQGGEGDNSAGDAEAEMAREALLQTLDPPRPSVKTLIREMMRSSAATNDVAFSLSDAAIEFGAAKKRGGESRVVHVRNHTAAKATAVWSIPPGSVFQVVPLAQDIPRFGSADFHLRCRPGTGASYHSTTLECYAFFKTMRSFRLATETGVVPPLCLPLRCGAHTFLSDDHFPARMRLSAAHVVFPAVNESDVSFQTITLYNDGDTPARYEVALHGETSRAEEEERAARIARGDMPDMYGEMDGYDQSGSMARGSVGSSVQSEGVRPAAERVFEVYPRTGVVAAGCHQVLCLSFRPQLATVYRCNADVLFNYSTAQKAPLRLEGSAFTPSLILKNDATVFFKPTAVGTGSTRSYVIENPCRVFVRYAFEVPRQWARVIRVEPVSGVLKGNQKTPVRLHFTPDKAKRYMLRLPITCSGVGDDFPGAGASQKLALTVLAEGTQGSLTLEPPAAEFHSVLVGETESHEITVFNSTTCDTAFAMGWVPDPLDEQGAAAMATVPKDVITFSVPTGKVCARAHLTMRVYFRPHHRMAYRFKIFCRAYSEGRRPAWQSSDGTQRDPTPEELAVLPFCGITATGSYPVMEVVDVRCITISKAHLWQQMSVDPINEALQLDIDHADKDRGQFEFQTICERHPHFTVDFGAAVQSTPPTKVLVTVANTSRIPVDFEFFLPSDSEVPIERWFHEETPTGDDVHRERILDHDLFAVRPRRGRILPDAKTTIEWSYRHKFAEAHRLPVILAIDRGRRLVLDFVGRTLRQDERYLDLASTMHEFNPVAIGDLDAPAQYFELRNASHVSVNYELGAEPFQKVCSESFDFPVFQCLNSYGEIPPLSSVMLRWCFRPLEARSYSMTVPIMVQGGPTYEVEFRGRGFHPKRVTAAEQAAMAQSEFLAIHPFPAFQADPQLLPMVLSQDVLSFGRVPVHSLHRRLLILRNRHPSDAFIFEWKTELQHGEQIVEVQPPTGRIAPGDHVVCKLSFYVGSLSQVIDQSIQCHVLNDDLRLRRQAQREIFEEEQRMNLDPAEDDMQSTRSPDGRATLTSMTEGSTAGSPPGRKSRKRAARVPVTQPPPKYQTTAQLQMTMQKLLDQADPGNLEDDDPDLVWVDVQPTALDLRLQVRVMAFDAYRNADPDGWARQFMPTLAVYQQHVDAIPPAPDSDLRALQQAPPQRTASTASLGELRAQRPTAEEGDFAKQLLNQLLQEVVHDPAVHQAYVDLDEVPIPYYCEYAGTPARSRPASAISLSDTQPPTPAQPPGEDEDVPPSTALATEAFPVGTEVQVPSGARGVVVGHARGRVGVELKGGAKEGHPPGALCTPEGAAERAEASKRRQRRGELRQHLERTLELRQDERRSAVERALLQSGDFQCMAEEVFENIVFDIIKDAALDPADPARSLVPARKHRLRQSISVGGASPGSVAGTGVSGTAVS